MMMGWTNVNLQLGGGSLSGKSPCTSCRNMRTRRCCAVRKLTRGAPYPQTRHRPIAYDAGVPS